jgi:hypothetical protein
VVLVRNWCLPIFHKHLHALLIMESSHSSSYMVGFWTSKQVSYLPIWSWTILLPPKNLTNFNAKGFVILGLPLAQVTSNVELHVPLLIHLLNSKSLPNFLPSWNDSFKYYSVSSLLQFGLPMESFFHVKTIMYFAS